jgi:hypothetical protein
VLPFGKIEIKRKMCSLLEKGEYKKRRCVKTKM